ncbi:hypothetical protein STEG23_013967 [Scotinomys teguina]
MQKVAISTSTFFDGLLVTGLYTSTSIQSSQGIGGSSAFGFGFRLEKKSHKVGAYSETQVRGNSCELTRYSQVGAYSETQVRGNSCELTPYSQVGAYSETQVRGNSCELTPYSQVGAYSETQVRGNSCELTRYSQWPQSLHPDTFGGRGLRNIQTLLEEEWLSLPKTQQPDTFGGREPRSIQTPLEEASLPRTKEHPDTIRPRGPRSIQSPLEEEDQGQTPLDQEDPEHSDTCGGRTAQALPRTKEYPDTNEQRDLPPSKVEMGRRQCKVHTTT